MIGHVRCIFLRMKVEVTRTVKRIVQMRVEDGVLKVVANMFLSDRKLRQIIKRHSEWISAHRETRDQPSAVESVAQKEHTDECADGGMIRELFAGKKTLILGVTVDIRPTKRKTYLDGETLYIAEKYYETRESIAKAVKGFLKHIDNTRISEEVANFGSEASLCPTRIEYKDNIDFWVSCSLASKRVLCFDFRIAQLPEHLRRYVIAHGFAHFSHPLHDRAHACFMDRYVRNAGECARELERYGILKSLMS